jgi:ABC-type uncharacterized transport system permease subunit
MTTTKVPPLQEGRASRRLLIVASGAVVLILGAVFYFFVYMPTVRLYVVNDTSSVVRVTVCGSDPQVVQHGQTVEVGPNRNDAKAACVIFEGTSAQAVGCLYVPTTRLSNGDRVKVSAMVRGVPADRCGD